MVYCETISAFPSLQNAGLSPRLMTPGPEKDLVLSFVASGIPAAPEGQELTIFIEPKLESGYPDIVAVYWDHLITKSWSGARSKLTKNDLRLLQFLVLSADDGSIPIGRVYSSFGRGPKSRQSLGRLLRAELIDIDESESLFVRPLSEIFAVRRLIAIEAKISDWKSALAQAFQNTWFASESYLLLRDVPKRSNLQESAAQFGLGVLGPADELDVAQIAARQDNLPKSHASWLFNEWAWKASLS